MAHVAMPTIVPTNCPSWCSDQHDDSTTHANLDVPPIEVTDLTTGKHAVVCVDLEQTDDDPKPTVVLHGCLFDAKLSAADAKRIGLALIAQAELAENAR